MKTFLKRRLSILMAVLMLLSCWVFVPQKAEAVTAGTGYEVGIVINSSDDWSWDGNISVSIKYKENNGQGSNEKTATGSIGTDQTSNYSKSVAGFPTSVSLTAKAKNGGCDDKSGAFTFTVKVNGTTLGTSATVNVGTSNSTGTYPVDSSAYPKATTVEFVDNVVPGDITIPTSGSATTSFRTRVKDQYGVIIGGVKPTASLNYTKGCSATYGTTTNNYDPGTISVSNDAKIAGSTNTKTVTLTASYTFNGATKEATKDFTLTDPQYTFTYNANEGTHNGKASHTTYYGNPVGSGNIPTSGTRDGYEYIGMYTSDNKNSYAFTKPVAGTTSGYTGQLTTNTAVNSDTTWYAAWWAKTYNVRFVDVDGNILDEDGNPISFYDKDGNPIKAYDITGKPIKPYDVKYKIVKVYDAEHNEIEVYDKDGNVVSVGTVIYSFLAKYDKPVTDYVSADYIKAITDKQKYHNNPSDTGSTFDYSCTGWVVDEATDANGYDYTGSIGGLDPNDVVLKGDVTFRPSFEQTKNKYTVEFYGTNGNELSSKTDFIYRDDAATIKPADPTLNSNTSDYTYRFKGWKGLNEKLQGKSYFIVNASSRDVDTNNYVSTTSDFTVRCKQYYYPVFEKCYTVKFYDKDGSEIVKYTDKDGNELSLPSLYAEGADITKADDQVKPEDNTYTYKFKGWTKAVPGANGHIVDADFVDIYTNEAVTLTNDFIANANTAYYPVFEATYIEYEVVVTDEYGINTTHTLHYGDPVPVVKEYKPGDGYTYTFLGWEDGAPKERFCEGNATYFAVYYTQAAVYVIKFVDYNGNTIETYNIEHNKKLTEFATATQVYYDYGDPDDKSDNIKYTFDAWEDKDGFGPTKTEPVKADATYYAKYETHEILPVEYIVGKDTVYTDYAFEGDTIPAYVGDTPEKPDDVYNKDYVFNGWADENENTVLTMPAEGVKLYAQFSGTQVEYTVTFKTGDKDPVTQKYTYGQKVEVPVVEDYKDVKYEYTFKNEWSPALPLQMEEDGEGNEVYYYYCVGNAEHEAKYDTHNRYYEVEFYTQDFTDDPENPVPVKIETTNTKFLNGQIIRTPAKPQAIDENLEAGLTWKFIGWKRNDTGEMYNLDRINGEAQGDNIISYTAVFEKVGAECEVIFKDADGTEISKDNVAYKTVLSTVLFDAEKYPDNTNHYVFKGWTTDEEGNNPVNTEKKLTESITLYAQFTAVEHTWTADITSEPKFDSKGSYQNVCSCEYIQKGEDGKDKKYPINELTDDVAPDATLEIGDSTWVDSEGRLPVSKNTLLTVNTNDTANPVVNETLGVTFNQEGKGHGVATIEMTLTESKVNAKDIPADYWGLVKKNEYGIEKTNVNYTENLCDMRVTAKGENDKVVTIYPFKDMTDGQSFVIYFKVTDRSGNVKYIESDVLVFDATAPVISIDDTNKTKDDFAETCANLACNYAKVTVSDANSTTTVVKLNGTVITTADDGIYTAPGKYVITVTDVVGNETKEMFTLAAHDMVNRFKAATCVEDGYNYDECSVCKLKIYNGEQELATGEHKKQGSGIYHEAVCNNTGYTTWICKVCNEEIRVDDNPATTGHIGKVIERKAPNCQNDGYEKVQCTVCGEIATNILPADPNAHEWVFVSRIEPTIYKTGRDVYKCKVCGIEDDSDSRIIAKVPSIGFKVAVRDQAGNPISGARISLYDNETGAVMIAGVTDSNGIDSLRVAKSQIKNDESHKYIIVAETYDYTKATKTVTGNALISADGQTYIITVISDGVENHECSCTCHNDSLLGKIFRFFQEIGYLFTKKYKCCNNPDSLYRHVD